jgi:hypothetical protein
MLLRSSALQVGSSASARRHEGRFGLVPKRSVMRNECESALHSLPRNHRLAVAWQEFGKWMFELVGISPGPVPLGGV